MTFQEDSYLLRFSSIEEWRSGRENSVQRSKKSEQDWAVPESGLLIFLKAEARLSSSSAPTAFLGRQNSSLRIGTESRLLVCGHTCVTCTCNWSVRTHACRVPASGLWAHVCRVPPSGLWAHVRAVYLHLEAEISFGCCLSAFLLL